MPRSKFRDGSQRESSKRTYLTNLKRAIDQGRGRHMIYITEHTFSRMMQVIEGWADRSSGHESRGEYGRLKRVETIVVMKEAFEIGEINLRNLSPTTIRTWLLKCLESLGIDRQGRGVGVYSFVMSYTIRTYAEEQFKLIESIGILVI